MLSRTDRACNLTSAASHLPAAFLIRAAAFFASSSVAKPMTAEYLLPIAWATKKLRPAPAFAAA